MSADPTHLLRLLEPTVRPGTASGVPGAGVAPRRAADAPFESKPFDLLLQEARAEQPAPEKTSTPAEAQTPNPLAILAGIGHIENTALRTQLEHARAAASHLLSDSPQSPSTPE